MTIVGPAEWRVDALEQKLKGRSRVDVMGESGKGIYFCSKHPDCYEVLIIGAEDNPMTCNMTEFDMSLDGDYTGSRVFDATAEQILELGEIIPAVYGEIDPYVWDISNGKEITFEMTKEITRRWTDLYGGGHSR